MTIPFIPTPVGDTGNTYATVRQSIDSNLALINAACSTTPAAGKILVADANGKIPSTWISVPLNDIGEPGQQGFGVGICPETLPAGMTELPGTRDKAFDNYGNYQYSDGSIMCWIPAFYYKIGTGSNNLVVNGIDIRPYSAFSDVTAANNLGYALHRAFYDEGVIKSGVFVDKYLISNNAGTASSIKNSAPLSSASTHNQFAALTGAPPNTYYGALIAAKTRGSNFFCSSKFIFAALALLSLAHGNAAESTTYCAWYDSAKVKNFPKGNNNNALKDSDDTTVTYTTDGYPNCGLTGSGVPFAKTTHNGQNCGVVDLNGNLYEINPGLTCVATSKNITAIAKTNPCQITIVGHGYTTGSVTKIEGIVGTTELNGKLFKVTNVSTDVVSLDNVDATGFTTYVSGGTSVVGTFYVLKQSVAMKNLTGGNTSATDHWGTSGIANNFDSITLNFNTTYPNNSFGQRFGSTIAQVLLEDVTGNNWKLTSLGLPKLGGISTAGINAFGLDYYYQYVIND
ncbi:hypothetical protein JZU46_04300, partial [bacterium]|nr:hypothetical protein [bacterium]